jgi:hypothetical protein
VSEPDPVPGGRLSRRRHTDKLLTFDRALLLLIFAAGGWVATADIRNADLKTRVEQVERRATAHEEQHTKQRDEILQELGSRSVEDAVIRTKLENIEKAMVGLADALNRLVAMQPYRRPEGSVPQ